MSARRHIAVGALLVAACTGPARAEVASLSSTVARFRSAEPTQKAERAGDVARVACSDAEVCAVRSVCLKGVETTLRGLARKDEALRALAQMQQGNAVPGIDAPDDLRKKLDEAQTLLTDGYKTVDECDVKLATLRRKYGLVQ